MLSSSTSQRTYQRTRIPASLFDAVSRAEVFLKNALQAGSDDSVYRQPGFLPI